MSPYEPSDRIAMRTLLRDRVLALSLVLALTLLGASASAGVPPWITTPLILILGVLLGLRILVITDRAEHRLNQAERELIQAIWKETTPPDTQLSSSQSSPQSPADLINLLLQDRSTRSVQHAELVAVIDAVEIAILATDASGRLIVANPAAQSLIGGSAPLVGRAIDDVFTHPDLVAIATSARRGVARTARIRLPRPGSVLLLDVAAVPMRTLSTLSAPPSPPPPASDSRPSRTGVVLALRDVTELATAVQLKTDFVANASHELRTPLASIRAAVETIQDFAGDDPEARARFLGTIAVSVARLEELCRDLLDLSRLESPDVPVERRPVHLDEIASELSRLFEPVTRERDLTLSFEIEPDVLTIQTDPRLLALILKNLVENATKFAYQGSIIRVTCASAPRDQELSDTTSPHKRMLVIEVIDRGLGIPISLQHRIFERFFQVDSARTGTTDRRGTGLGLAIVKHACRALDGRITVNSVWKQGTTMRVEIPACLIPANSTPDDADPPHTANSAVVPTRQGSHPAAPDSPTHTPTT